MVKARKIARDDPGARLAREAMKLNLGKTALPDGAVIMNANAIPQRNALTPPGKTEATTHKKTTHE